MSGKIDDSLPISKPCPECAKENNSGRLELLRSLDLDHGREVRYALCTRKGCLYHIQKMPLFMYESCPGDKPGK